MDGERERGYPPLLFSHLGVNDAESMTRSRIFMGINDAPIAPD